LHSRRIALLMIVLIPVLIDAAVRFGAETRAPGHQELTSPCALRGPGGEQLLTTALSLTPGDLYVDSQDRCWQIVRVERGTARARPVAPPWNSDPGPAVPCIPLGALPRTILIYHTHGDESYVPSEGTSSIPTGGGILRVGERLATSLRDVGFRVLHDRSTHWPHDALAYHRSRRTVFRYLPRGPYLLFDIHRDGAPARAYRGEVAGEPVAQILLVVGRLNPMRQANLALARAIKKAADRSHPGLIKGILLARGHYNQDLDPGALLLEVGCHQLPRSEAERSVKLLAAVLAGLYGAPGR